MTIKIDFEKLKYLFIDFDGTLVDTIPMLFDNYYNFLKKYGREGTLKEFQTLMGPSIEEFISILKTEHELPQNPQELLEIYTLDLAERYKQEIKLIEGSQQFLDYAKAIGLKLALVTSSAYPLIEGSLEKLRLQNYFEYMVTGEKVRKTKPDPEIYLLALKFTTTKPDQVLAIEDSYNGILAAVRAGIPTIAIKNDHLLDTPEKAMSINSWDDLLRHFKDFYAK